MEKIYDGGYPNGSYIHAMRYVVFPVNSELKSTFTHKVTNLQEYRITVLSSQNNMVGCPLGVPISYLLSRIFCKYIDLDNLKYTAPYPPYISRYLNTLIYIENKSNQIHVTIKLSVI